MTNRHKHVYMLVESPLSFILMLNKTPQYFSQVDVEPYLALGYASKTSKTSLAVDVDEDWQ